MSDPAGLPDIDIDRWTKCEFEALHGPSKRTLGNGRIHVGELVRHRVMAQLAGEDCGTGELTLGGVILDPVTRRIDDVPRQARVMAEEIERLVMGSRICGEAEFEPWGFRMQASHMEVDGHRYVDPWIAVHVRTGKFLGSAWLSVGRRLARMEPGVRENLAAIVHVPRAPLDKALQGWFHVRQTHALLESWQGWRSRVEAVLVEGQAPLRRPGRHCGLCRLECGVRS